MPRVFRYRHAEEPFRIWLSLAASLLLVVMSSLFPVMAENLQIVITANVVEPSCSVVVDDKAQLVKMGDLDADKLQSAGKSDPTLFNIRLEKCNTQNANIVFNSKLPDGKGGFYPQEQDGNKFGYVLMFTNTQGSSIPLGSKQVLSLSGANNTLTFGVIAAKSSGELRTGDFSATATATISYL